MSENRDLELLKKGLMLVNDEQFYLKQEMKDAIAAAERMAAEIAYERERNQNNVAMLSEQLAAKDKEIAELETSRDDWKRLWELEMVGKKHAEEEIEKLEAKMATRQKVVYCGDCKKAYHTKITFALKCRTWGCQVSPKGYCSRGARRK